MIGRVAIAIAIVIAAAAYYFKPPECVRAAEQSVLLYCSIYECKGKELANQMPRFCTPYGGS